MITEVIPRNKIFKSRCNACSAFYGFKGGSFIFCADIGYCEYCGFIFYHRYFYLVNSYLGNEVCITIGDCVQDNEEEIELEFRISDTVTDLVTSLLNNKSCTNCRGNKQVWNIVNKMMEDCTFCEGSGIC